MKTNQVIEIGNIVHTGNWSSPQRGRIYSPNGISPCLNTCGGGGLEPKILEIYERKETKQEFKEQGTNKRYRIRKLTPRECFRLMDLTESDIDKIQNAGISESQQYRMAGNSIVVSCMVGIFKNLFCEESEPQTGQLTLF